MSRRALPRLVTLLRALPALLALPLTAAPASAVEVGEPGQALTVSVHGFVSQGFILSSRYNYLAKSKQGSAEFSEIGLNFTVPVTEKLRVGMQLFSRIEGRTSWARWNGA